MYHSYNLIVYVKGQFAFETFEETKNLKQSKDFWLNEYKKLGINPSEVELRYNKIV